MALILKPTKTIENPHTGVTFSTAYAVVDNHEGKKKQKNQIVTVHIFVSKSNRDANRQALRHKLAGDYGVSGQDWLDYFAIDKISPEGTNSYKQSYLWLIEKATEEGNEILIFADWESDEAD